MQVDLQALTQTLTQTLGWPAIELIEMAGSTSARLFEVRSADQRAVVRCFDAQRWEQRPEDLSAREAGILSALSGTHLPAPELLATLPENGVVMTLMPGRVWLPQRPDQAWLQALAAMLTRIHSTPVVVPSEYQSWNSMRTADPVDWWPDDRLWRDCQQLLSADPEATATFIHRDYHPVNLLWQDQQISAVVDWINACMGPAAVDVAHCRLNLATMYGVQSADDFLAAYQHQNPDWNYRSYWDLDAAFSSLPDVKVYPPWHDFGLSGLTDQIIRQRLLSFVTNTIDKARDQGETS